MEIAEKVGAIVNRMAQEARPAAWLAFLLFVLKADNCRRYNLESAGPALLCRLADKLPLLGVWASVSDLLTIHELTKKRRIISALREVSIDLIQTQSDLRLIAREIINREIEADARGRARLDVIGRTLIEITNAIESPPLAKPAS